MFTPRAIGLLVAAELDAGKTNAARVTASSGRRRVQDIPSGIGPVQLAVDAEARRWTDVGRAVLDGCPRAWQQQAPRTAPRRRRGHRPRGYVSERASSAYGRRQDGDGRLSPSATMWVLSPRGHAVCQAACDQTDLIDPVPGRSQHLRRAGLGAADRRAAALHLLRSHEPVRDARRRWPAAQHLAPGGAKAQGGRSGRRGDGLPACGWGA